MCYKGKCLMCIPVEHGCLAFAVISAIVTGLALVSCIISGALIIFGVIITNKQIESGQIDIPEFSDNDARVVGEGAVIVTGIAFGIVIAIVGVASFIAFIFSVLLCNGISNRRPGHVKAYFVYGVVITVLAVLASVTEIYNSQDPAIGIAVLLGCVVYSLFLVLVHQTYTKLLDGTIFAVKGGHVRLVES